MTNPPDTAQQEMALRQNRTARVVRRRFGAGTRVTSGQMDGTVLRHVPGLNSQGGHLKVEWDNGHVGRISPIAVQVLPPTSERT